MTNIKDFLKKFKFSYLGLAALFAIVGWLVLSMESERPGLRTVTQKIEKHLHSQEETVKAFFELDSLIEHLVSGRVSASEVQQIARNEIIFHIYKNDSLIFWSDNSVMLRSPISTYRQYDQVVLLDNGYYELVREPWPPQPEITLAALLPLRYNYPVENRYLSNDIAVLNGEDLEFSLTPKQKAQPVQNEKGETLFYVRLINQNRDTQAPVTGIVFVFIGVLFFCLWLFYMADSLSKATHPVIGFLALLVALVAIRFFTLGQFYPLVLKDFEFFTSQFFASSRLAAPSMGDLFINAALLLLAVFFFFAYFKIPAPRHKVVSLIIEFTGYLLSLLYLLLICRVIKSLVLDSTISFNINNFLTLDIYSFIGLFVIALLILSYFLFNYRLIRNFNRFNTGFWLRLTGIGAALVMAAIITSPNHSLHWFTTISASLVIVLLFLFLWKKLRANSFYSIIVWLIFFSVFTAFLLNYYNGQKEWQQRKLVAMNIAQEKDYVAEYLLEEIRPEILDDDYLKRFFLMGDTPTTYVSSRFHSQYLRDHLNRYELHVHAFGGNGKPLGHEEQNLAQWQQYMDTSALATDVENLFYVPGKGASYSYLYQLDFYERPIPPQGDQLGTLILELQPKNYSFTNVYPELLLQENIKPTLDLEAYSIAVYTDGRLQQHQGNYPYDLNLEVEPGREFQRIKDGDFVHLVFKASPGVIVWVSRQVRSNFEPFSLFSYIFCLFLIVVVLVLIIERLRLIYSKRQPASTFMSFTFRHKIQVYVLSIIIISFLGIGFLTIRNTINQYDEYHHDRLLRKVSQVQSGLEYMQVHNDSLPADWAAFFANEDLLFDNLSTLSDIHSMDINIYDREGNLVTSSQPEIFDKGLISRKINPVAYHQIMNEKASQFINTESIGRLKYLSAYVPLMDNNDEVMALLNLPYFAKEKNLESEISAFLVYFINVYVFLLVFAGILGLIVSNSVTKPMAEIGNKLKQVKLGQRNEPIVWHHGDEIGKLIAEYNRMIMQLEDSAELLAKSERESAWREMAKQVAHEIKNPLTPMKLSIQHLQRAYKENRPNRDEMVENVTNTLIEQIENLSRIASEFSSFAKMPVPVKESLYLNSIIESVWQLYRNEEAEISLNLPSEQLFVYADKSQLMRVFSNLVKNALQAIPDEREGKIDITLKRTDGKALVEVADNGTGISEEEAERVFVPNFTTKGSGMGLGLAMSKNIIETSGGTIWFESEEGEGTVFYVELPLHSP